MCECRCWKRVVNAQIGWPTFGLSLTSDSANLLQNTLMNSVNELEGSATRVFANLGETIRVNVEAAMCRLDATRQSLMREATSRIPTVINELLEFILDCYQYWGCGPLLFFSKAVLAIRRLINSWRVNVQESVISLLTKFCGQRQTNEVQAQIDAPKARSIFGFIGTAMMCAFAAILPDVCLDTKKFDSLLRRIDLIPKAFSGAGKMYDMASSTCERVARFACEQVGIPWTEGEQCEFDKFVVNVDDLYTKMRTDTMQVGDKDEIVKLLWTRRELQTKMMRVAQGYSSDKRTAIYKSFGRVDELCTFAQHKGWMYQGGREPIALQFVGEPGCGKSSLIYPLSAFLCKYLDVDVGEKFNVKDHVYDYPKTSNHFDGYDKQPIVLIDDGLQIKDSPSAPNPELMTIIQMVNEAKFLPPMADLASKGVVFDSRVILMTTNKEQYPVYSIHEPSAFWRRFKYRVRVSLLPEVQHDPNGTSADKGLSKEKLREWVTQQGMEYQAGKLYLDVFRFTLLDHLWLEKPRIVRENLDYKQFFRIVRDLVQDQAASANKRNDQMDEFLNLNVDAQISTLGSLYEPPQLNLSMNDVMNEHLSGTSDDDDDDDPYFVDPYPRQIVEEESRVSSVIRKFISSVKNHWVLSGLLVSGVIGCCALLSSCLKPKRKFDTNRIVRRFELADDALNRMDVPLCEECDDIAFDLGLDDNVNNRSVITAWRRSTGSDQPCTCFVEGEGPYAAKDTRSQPRREGPYATKDTRSIPRREGPYANAERRSQPRREGSDVAQEGPYANVDRRQLPRREGPKPEGEDVCGSKPMRAESIYCPTVVNGEMSSDITLNDLIVKKVLCNTFRATVGGDNKQAYNICGVMIKGQIALMNAHSRFMFEDYDEVNFTFGSVKQKIPTSTITLVEGDNDVMLVHSPLFRRSVDIVKYFYTEDDFKTRPLNRITLVRPQKERVPYYLASGDSSYHGSGEPLTMMLHGAPTGMIHRYLMYDVDTASGDCGSLVCAQDKRCDRKFVGIHAYGSEGRLKNGGVVVTQEILRQMLAAMPCESCVSPQIDDGSELSVNGAACVIGSVRENFVPCKTTFAQNPNANDLAEKLGVEITTKPAALRSVLVDGVIVDPMERGLKKVLKPNVAIEQDYVDAVENFMTKKLLTNFVRSGRDEKILTIEEAVHGIPEGPNELEPMDLSTSAGYPWVFKKESGKLGKRTWIDHETKYIAPELREAINKKLEDYKQGQTNTVFQSTLKDERRPIAKVDAGKTRVFFAGPQDFTILFRMYFLQFMMYLQDNRIYNGIAVGINPLGPEWGELYKFLRAKGSRALAGDFEQYDGTMLLQFQDIFVNIANKFYDDGEENAMIRQCLWRDVTHALVAHKGKVIGLTHGMASGCPATAVANSVYNLSVMYYSMAKIVESEHPTFESALKSVSKQVAVVTYGDDNVISVPDVTPIDFEKVSDYLSEIGMTYTSEDKSGRATIKSLCDVTFLKRKFYNCDGLTFGPIEKNTIYELMFWHRKHLDDETQMIVNMENAMRELALWNDEKLYKKAEKELYRYCSEQGFKLRPEIMTMKGIQKEVYFPN